MIQIAPGGRNQAVTPMHPCDGDSGDSAGFGRAWGTGIAITKAVWVWKELARGPPVIQQTHCDHRGWPIIHRTKQLCRFAVCDTENCRLVVRCDVDVQTPTPCLRMCQIPAASHGVEAGPRAFVSSFHPTPSHRHRWTRARTQSQMDGWMNGWMCCYFRNTSESSDAQRYGSSHGGDGRQKTSVCRIYFGDGLRSLLQERTGGAARTPACPCHVPPHVSIPAPEEWTNRRGHHPASEGKRQRQELQTKQEIVKRKKKKNRRKREEGEMDKDGIIYPTATHGGRCRGQPGYGSSSSNRAANVAQKKGSIRHAKEKAKRLGQSTIEENRPETETAPT